MTRWHYISGRVEALGLHWINKIVESTVEVEPGCILDFFRDARAANVIEDRRSLSVFGETEFVLRCVADFFQVFRCHKHQRTTGFVVGLVSDGKGAAMFCVLSVVRPVCQQRHHPGSATPVDHLGSDTSVDAGVPCCSLSSREFQSPLCSVPSMHRRQGLRRHRNPPTADPILLPLLGAVAARAPRTSRSQCQPREQAPGETSKL